MLPPLRDSRAESRCRSARASPLCHVIGNSRILACLGLVLEPSSFPTTSSPCHPRSPLQMSKKGAKIIKEVRQYSIGDVVLGKVRGYPPWPAMVSAKSR
jgi:hypothetical protein